MRIVELIHRVARRARTGDFTQLNLAEKGDVLQSANGALQEVYQLLPIYFKQMTLGFLLPGPADVSCQCTQYSTALGNSPFTESQIGNTVIIEGDEAWNQIVGVNELQNPYMGTTGTQTATVYGDSIFSTRYPLDRIVNNPRFADQSQLAIVRRDLMNASAPYYGNLSPSFGRPNQWCVQPGGNSQRVDHTIYIRFFPLPDEAYSITVDIAYWPQRILLEDYVFSNIELTVPDQFLETCLVPLALRNLMTTPAFASNGPNDALILDAAIRAEAFLRNQVGQVGAPSNCVLTPIGF